MPFLLSEFVVLNVLDYLFGADELRHFEDLVDHIVSYQKGSLFENLDHKILTMPAMMSPAPQQSTR